MIFAYNNIDYFLFRDDEKEDIYEKYMRLLNTLPSDIEYQEFTMNTEVIKLVEDGFMTREKQGRSYHLGLTPAGERAFRTCHQVFFDWDAQNLSGLTEEEQHQLLSLLQKAARTRKESV